MLLLIFSIYAERNQLKNIKILTKLFPFYTLFYFSYYTNITHWLFALFSLFDTDFLRPILVAFVELIYKKGGINVWWFVLVFLYTWNTVLDAGIASICKNKKHSSYYICDFATIQANTLFGGVLDTERFNKTGGYWHILKASKKNDTILLEGWVILWTFRPPTFSYTNHTGV